MRSGMLWLSVLAALLIGSPSWAQEGDAGAPVDAPAPAEAVEPEAQPEAEPEVEPIEDRVTRTLEELRLARPGHLRSEPWTVPVSELELEFQPLRLDAVQERVGAWLELLKSEVQQRNNAQVGIERATRAGRAEGATLDEELVAAFTARLETSQERISQLLERLNVGLAVIERRGGNVESERSYINAIRSLRLRISEDESREDEARRAAESALTDEQRRAAERAAAIASAVERVRRDPPVHERPEPWRIPLRELDLELQPLTTAKIKERADIWSEILERRVRERNRLLIAADNPENQAIASALAAQATETEAVIQAIVDRMEVLLRLMEKRGEDTASYRQYISDVTGIKLNLTNINVLASQVWAWMTSDNGGIRWGLRALGFLATLVAFYIAGKFIGAAIGTAVKRLGKGSSAMLKSVIVGMTRKVIMIIGFVIALGVLGINITPLVAAIGAAGLVIGLALQGTLSNFASGILILVNKPFDVGDAINAGGVTGKVEGLTLVNTRILTFDNQVMYVPNNQVWNGVITNLTGRSTRRVDLVFGIGYKDDMAKAERIISEVVNNHPKTLKDPAPNIKVHELGDSSVNFIVRPWSNTSDYWDVYWDLTRQIKERFDAEGVGIPYPQRDLHVPGQIEVVLGDRRRTVETKPKAEKVGAVRTGNSMGEPGPAEDDEPN